MEEEDEREGEGEAEAGGVEEGGFGSGSVMVSAHVVFLQTLESCLLLDSRFPE